MDVFPLNQYFNYYLTQVLNMKMITTMFPSLIITLLIKGCFFFKSIFQLLLDTSIEYEDDYNHV